MVKDITIDVVGNFADGKTTLVRAITSESTLRHSEEKKRGITIRLGYAHFLIYKCDSCGSFSRHEKCEVCNSNASLYYRVSIIDSPGHKTLMTIMLSGATLVDGAVLVIAANQKCPQPQTQEHIEALRIIGVKNIVVAQTKIDVVGKDRAKESYNEIKDFMSKNGYPDAKIIPVFAAQDVNITELIQEIGKFEVPDTSKEERTEMVVVRSFDINRPGADINELKGGVLGGGLKSGSLKINDSVVVYPGVYVKNSWKPLKTKVLSIQSEFGPEKEVARGLMIGLETDLDPSLARRDNLAGSLIVKNDTVPLFKSRIAMKYEPIKDKFSKPPQKNETVLLNVLSSKVLGTVVSYSNNGIIINLGNSALPYFIGERAILSRKINNVWTIAGSGNIYE
ncbi:MAG: translation initiation factor IF-2 subunit gamma [Candidatus Parvarchaeota archaeon]|nr:translation initiation factor IF-2 subunit gamma [Candidatus Parvarchaeota archaeon]MCW1295190.1 translation initiation factor IF-2 subunit gamma [Candidatus Parvarchaeum tengchongense]MCW1299513.1 translation initiation factor IF-2 subunit gamma [Candidatus Parvarchaeum tengchongense]MCW1312274.1 translation initiation factor IF-2 subunit gamma [Candidatus Parvarchaeum tengchongense]